MHSLANVPFHRQQQFLLDADTDVLCRIVGLYAARGIHIAKLDYSPVAIGTGRLIIIAMAEDDVLRILVAKAASLFGVIRAEPALAA